MKRLLIIFFIFFNFSATQSQTSAQSLKNDNSDSPSISNDHLEYLTASFVCNVMQYSYAQCNGGY